MLLQVDHMGMAVGQNVEKDLSHPLYGLWKQYFLCVVCASIELCVTQTKAVLNAPRRFSGGVAG